MDDIVVPRNIVVCEYDNEDGMNIIKMITISPLGYIFRRVKYRDGCIHIVLNERGMV